MTPKLKQHSRLSSRHFRQEAPPFVTAFALLLALLVTGSAAAETSSGYEMPLTRQASGAYTVSGSFGDTHHTDLLVDTGSSYVVLSPATFRKLSANQPLVKTRTIRGAMADGQVVEAPVYSVPSLALGTGCTLKNVDAIVLRGASRDILGLSALKRMGGVTLDFSPQRLRFSTCLTI